MFVALDKDGCRVMAHMANKDNEYFCPVCGEKVLLRSGSINIEHFAHLAGACEDKWDYDMSAWHLKMQEFFPEKNREVVVKAGGRIHRADVLVGNTVIEMQHSPIAAEEFEDRNNFFGSIGYRVVWIFDMRDRMDGENMAYLDGETVTKLKWRHPMRMFASLEGRISDYNKSFALYFHLYDDEDDEDSISIFRVVWTRTDEDGVPDFSRFAVAAEDVRIEYLEDMDEFFTPVKDKRRAWAERGLASLVKEAREKGFPCKIKHVGEKGHTRDSYICPRTGKFGIRPYGSGACRYCQHCAMEFFKEHNPNANGRDTWAYCCCFPYTYREPDNLEYDPEYECMGDPDSYTL